MRIKKILFTILSLTALLSGILLPLPAGASENASGEDPENAKVDELIRDFRKETKCGHVSIVIFDRGVLSYYGDREDLFQIGSMTKAFTGLAVKTLIQRDLLSEDDLVSDLIPGFAAHYGSEKVNITVRDLLSQKSGYTNNEQDYPSAAEEMTLREWADSISGRELRSRPGTEYAYSNVNYNLLGLIIENVSGTSYREFMENEILHPLGLANTFVGTPEEKSIAEGSRLAYRNAVAYPIRVREASIPAGYFYSNAEDMGRWLGILTGKEEIPEDIASALSAVKSELLKTGDYTSGWERFEGNVIGHSGGTPNYSSRIVWSAEDQKGVCVLTDLNVAASTDSLCNAVYAVVSGSGDVSLRSDVWTVFDRIFTAVSLFGIALILFVLRVKKKAALIATGSGILLLLILVWILFPLIFGAGMGAILFTWAPLSLAGGLLLLSLGLIGIIIKLWMGNKNAHHHKTDSGSAADGDHRISGK